MATRKSSSSTRARATRNFQRHIKTQVASLRMAQHTKKLLQKGARVTPSGEIKFTAEQMQGFFMENEVRTLAKYHTPFSKRGQDFS